MATLPIQCLWVAVGNNPTFSDEVADRVVSCRLERPDVPRPRDLPRGKFKHDLDTWVPTHRAELVWSCLLLIQHWIAQGQKPANLTFGSFQRWAEVMGGILGAAGIPGLLSNRMEFLARVDEETDVSTAFVRAWWDTYRNEPTYTADLIELADKAGLEVSAKKDPDGRYLKSQQVKMGTFLKRHFRRPFVLSDGMTVRIERGDPPQDASGSRWCLVSALPGISGNPGNVGNSHPSWQKAKQKVTVF
jgi:hypothetical protein